MTTEEKILERLTNIEALMVLKDRNWLPKRLMMLATGMASGTLDNYVSSGRIEKKGMLYSYKSYIEYIETRR